MAQRPTPPRSTTMLRLTGLAMALLTVAPLAMAQDRDNCSPIGGAVPPNCQPANGDVAVRMPAQPNTEFDQGPYAASGLSIAIDGVPVAGDPAVIDQAHRADLALKRADVRVSFDGLAATPRLDVEILGPQGNRRPGDAVTLQSALNYPAFVRRAEFRIIDLGARGGPRTLAVVPVAPNGQAGVTLPEGRDLVVVHRVYDEVGRFDETAPLPLRRPDLVDGVEEGTDRSAIRRIPLPGGAVTVSGQAGSGAARVRALGETIRPAADGRFVLQRILPVGEHAVTVQVTGAGQPVTVTRQIEIPKADWFAFGLADMTAGWRENGAARSGYTQGRLAFFADGRTASGTRITAAADTGQNDLDALFRDLDARDPRRLFQRLDPQQYYPVYGDDSTFEEAAPTSGKLFLKVEKDGNHILWGNFRNRIGGTDYLRSERTLYGLQAIWASRGQTADGAPRASASLYAASPDNLPQRDVLRGTGGSVYFLQRQDIVVGSEALSVQLRDKISGRILSSTPLTPGRDYDIDYFSGIVTLSQPLSGMVPGGIAGGPGNQISLVAQYEYTPSGFDVSGQSYGGRVELAASDRLRFGVTGQVENTGTADQTALSVDATWRLNEETFLRIEAARSDGPGFASSTSTNGGLTITNGRATAGSGNAVKVDARAGFGDLGLAMPGHVAAYAERREAGFSSIDYQVSRTETLWGIHAEAEAGEALRFSLFYDAYDVAGGEYLHEGGLGAQWRAGGGLAFDAELVHRRQNDTSASGRRTDLALRATRDYGSDTQAYVFGRVTLDQAGLGRNDRIGLGGQTPLRAGWQARAELSTGTGGIGADARLSRETEDGRSLYFGYVLDPQRELAGYGSGARDRGQFVAGGREKIGPNVTTWAENTYDLFGQRQSLTSAYGVEYRPGDALTFGAGFELGDVIDPGNGDYRRSAISASALYSDADRTSLAVRAELRRDAAVGGTADTGALKLTARHKLNEAERLSFNLDALKTESGLASVPQGELIDATFGYALRPVTDDRLNMLFKYRYLYDMYGQQIDGTTTPGPRQSSHVLSVDAEYDLTRQWSIGAKLGYRLSESSPARGQPFAQNDAWLAVATARYHIVHEWDALIEARMLGAVQADVTDLGILGAVYRHVGNNAKIGLGYNFGRFSDDLTDLVQDDRGLFLNVIAKF